MNIYCGGIETDTQNSLPGMVPLIPQIALTPLKEQLSANYVPHQVRDKLVCMNIYCGGIETDTQNSLRKNGTADTTDCNDPTEQTIIREFRPASSAG